MFDKVTWLGHSGILVEAGLKLYFDPFNLPDGLPKADVVFLTHPHYDHCSPDDLAKIATDQTLFVGPADALAKVKASRTLAMSVGDKKPCAGFKVEAKPAYNLKKPYHPKTKGWLGFMVDLGGFRLYHAGDTDAVAEMEGLEPDLAFLPLDNLYHWGIHSAVAAVRALRPKRVLPLHFGTVCGTRMDAARFLAECEKLGLPGDFYGKEAAGASQQTIPDVAPERALGSAA